MRPVAPAVLLAGVLMLGAGAIPMQASALVSVGISVNIGPPALPYYPQPLCPGPGFIWTPGYWAYGPYGYYWVPGTWVLAPTVGFLWTPGYWGWRAGYYWWHPGYWGPRVGFYGGIDYGYGYTGVGFVGGAWRGNVFFYNRAASNVNVTAVHNVYNETVINDTQDGRVSFNGGTGGTTALATAEQTAYANQPHQSATAAQVQHEHTAMNNPGQRFSANNGRPDVAATERAGKFNGNGAVRMNEDRSSYAYHPGRPPRQAGHPMRPTRPHGQPHPPRERGGGGGEHRHRR